MFESDKKSGLDRLKKALYSRSDAADAASARHEIHSSDEEAPTDWQHADPAAREPRPDLHPKVRRWYKAALIGTAALFVAGLALALVTFFGGRSFVSVDNVDILVEGPVSVAGGEVLSLTASIVNENATEMELVDLIIEFPEGAKNPEDPSEDLERERYSIGNIKTGSVAQKRVDAILFGEEDQERQIKFTIEYRTPGSNAIFFKEKFYTVSIASSPLLVSLEALGRVTAGSEEGVKITVTSNSTSVVEDVLLVLEYPFGWTYRSSDPKPLYGDSVWRIGDLAPGMKKTVTIRGAASGEDGQERALHAHVGIQSSRNEKEIGTTIVSGSHVFTVERPFFGIDLTLNGERVSSVAVEPSRVVRSEILWANNGAGKIVNARIEAKISGIYDKSSVTVNNGGYYDSRTDTIVWEAGRIDEFTEITPGSSGRVGFTFYPTRSSSGGASQSQQIVISVAAAGMRTDQGGASESLQSAAQGVIKLVSNISLSARSLRSQGPFANTGPVPPRVDQTTTYTIVWTVTNTSNSISDAEVRATLPQGVAWLGVISPSDASITHADIGGEIVWRVGDVPRNATQGAKEVAFQVSITPRVTDEGRVPELVGPAVVTGIDDFTGVTLKNTAPAVTTRTTSDIFWKQGDEVVQE